MKLECSYYQIPKIVKFLDPSEWVLFTVMFDGWKIMKNEDDWYFHSEKQLSEESGLSISTVKRTIKKLKQIELILVKRHNDGYKNASYDKANEYKINMEKVVKLNPFNKKEGCQIEKEGCQNEPSYNKNVNNNNTMYYNSTMENSENCYDIESSVMKGSQNDRMNERSDNGTTEMNDTIPSTLENTINTMECTDPAPASQTQNKATGGHQTSEVEQLTTEEKIKRQEARKEEISNFNTGHDKHRYDMCHKVKTSADFDRYNALLQADINWVDACDWSEDRKNLWHRNYNYWLSKCEDKIMKNYNKILERERKKFG